MAKCIAQNREDGGRLVREAWVHWAKRQDNPKPSWLVEWKNLDELDKEADRCIWDDIVAPYATELERFRVEVAQLREDKDLLVDRIYYSEEHSV